MNTHGAYSDLQNLRNKALSARRQPTAPELLNHLTDYSTRGRGIFVCPLPFPFAFCLP